MIQANQAAEVAVISKTQAVTAAEQKVEVAAKPQAEAETMKKIAQIKAETAEIDKKATIGLLRPASKRSSWAAAFPRRKRFSPQSRPTAT